VRGVPLVTEAYLRLREGRTLADLEISAAASVAR
jgi:hypothetical protein